MLTCKDALFAKKKETIIGRKLFARRSMPEELAILPTNRTIQTQNMAKKLNENEINTRV
jgi:hypothetical protein